jgi:hypothetical protein
MMTNLISIAEAAAALQPLLGQLDAVNLLADWRRKRPNYRQRVDNPPRYCKSEAGIRYPRSEIRRVAEEIIAFRMRPPVLI